MKHFAPGELIEMQAKTYALYCACSSLPSLDCSEKRKALAFVAARVKMQLYAQYMHYGKCFVEKVNEFMPTEDEVAAMLK